MFRLHVLAGANAKTLVLVSCRVIIAVLSVDVPGLAAIRLQVPVEHLMCQFGLRVFCCRLRLC